MKGIRYAEGLNISPIMAPVDIVATATRTAYVDLDLVNWATFLVDFGAVASTDSTGEVVVTVLCSTAATTVGATAMAFNYRLSGAAAANTMGTITAATAAAGAAVGQADDNKILVIDVDPAAVAEVTGNDNRFLHLLISPTSEITSTVVGAIAVLEVRYPANTQAVST